MSEEETYADSLLRNYEAFVDLARRHPLLVGTLAAVTIAGGALWLYLGASRISDLREQLRSKDTEIQRLETQLAPFRAAALNRYPGSEAEALRQLGDDVARLQEGYEELADTIRSFNAAIRVDVAANWSTGSPPEYATAVFDNQPLPSVRIKFRHRSGESSDVYMFHDGHVQASPIEESASRVTYRARVPPDSPVLGTRIDQLEAVEEIGLELPEIYGYMLADDQLTIIGLHLTLFANGDREVDLDFPGINQTMTVPAELRESRRWLSVTLMVRFLIDQF